MPTYQEFMNMELVDHCSDKPHAKEVCDTCWIHNCTRSYLYRASNLFWSEHFRIKEANEIKLRLLSLKKPQSVQKKGFRLLEPQKGEESGRSPGKTKKSTPRS